MVVLRDKMGVCDGHLPTKSYTGEDIGNYVIDAHKNVAEIPETDNRGNEFWRPLFSHTDILVDLNWDEVWIEDFDFQSEFCYPITVYHNQSIWPKYLDILDDRILDSLRNKKGYILFDNTLEGKRIDGKHFLEPIYGKLEKLKIPPERIIFVTNNLLAEKQHDEYMRERIPGTKLVKNIHKKMKIISYMYSVADVKWKIYNHCLPSRVVIKNEIKYKESRLKDMKHFLKVNRTNRTERNLFMLFMNYHKLFDQSLISFPSLPGGAAGCPQEFKKYLTIENIEDLKSKVPFDIDRSDETNHGPAGFGKGKFNADLPFRPIHYKNSFISIVMCAFPFEYNDCHLHSGTYNPIYCGHPIVQFGPYQSLREIKERGFKTFDKWWDESYDDEPDGWKRLQKVMDVVLELSKLSQKELLEMYIDMKDVLQHNVDLITNFDAKSELYDRIFNNE